MVRGIGNGVEAALFVVVLVSVVVGVTFGVWDILVWLFKADWRTTHFEVPLWSLAFYVVAWVLERVVSPVAQWGARAEQWCDTKSDLIRKALADRRRG